jgi:hypothetical protein
MPHAVPVTTSPPSSALDEIRALSRPFAALFGFLFFTMAVAAICLIIATIFYTGPSFRFSVDSVSADRKELSIVAPQNLTEQVLATSVAISDLPLKTRLVGIVSIGTLQWGSLTMIFFYFRSLFRLYERGVVFAQSNVVQIRWLGFWLIAWGFAPAVGHQLCQIIGVHDEGWFRLSSVVAIVVGGLLYVIGRVVNLGREIEQDRASFV